MKKSIMATFAAIFLAATCVGFAACGTAGDSAEIAKDAAKDIVGIEVTEEEWNAALAYLTQDGAEYSVQQSSQEIEHEAGQYLDWKTTSNGRAKGGKMYSKTQSEFSGNIYENNPEDEMFKRLEKGVEKYSVYEGGTQYIYTKNDDDQWEKNPGGIDILAEMERAFYSSNYIHFSDYHYDAQEKGCIYPMLGAYGPTTIFKFGKIGNDVRLIAIYAFGEESWYSYEASIIFSYTNVADITLPDVV